MLTMNALQLVPAADASISSFQGFLGCIFSERNKKHSFEYIYAYADKTCGHVFKCIDEHRLQPKDVIRPISWLFALCESVGADLESALVFRYPGICSYCLSRPCVCHRASKLPFDGRSVHEAQTTIRQAAEAFSNNAKVVSLEFMTSELAAIYPQNEVLWMYHGPERQLAKIHEELAEVHDAFEAYKLGRKSMTAQKVALEIADVFAWLLSLWHIAYPTKGIGRALVDEYSDGCGVCGKWPCSCQDYNSGSGALMDPLLSELRKHLNEEREGDLNEHRDVIDPLIAAIDAALDSDDKPLMQRARWEALVGLGQLLAHVHKIRNALASEVKTPSVIERLEKVVRAGSNVEKLIGWVGSILRNL